MGKTANGEIIAATSHLLDFPLSESDQIVDTILSSMIDAISREESIELRSLGTFHLNRYGSSRGRNPPNGQVVSVTPKQVSIFQVGKLLRNAVKDGREM